MLPAKSKPIPKLEIGLLGQKRSQYHGPLEMHDSNNSFKSKKSTESNTAKQEQHPNSFTLTEQNQFRLNSSSPTNPQMGKNSDFKHSA